MQKKKAQPTLDVKELEIIHLLYGVGCPTSSPEFAPHEPRLSESEVRRIEARALRKLRRVKLENLTQLWRAG